MRQQATTSTEKIDLKGGRGEYPAYKSAIGSREPRDPTAPHKTQTATRTFSSATASM
jgi:hypothetical protein